MININFMVTAYKSTEQLSGPQCCFMSLYTVTVRVLLLNIHALATMLMKTCT